MKSIKRRLYTYIITADNGKSPCYCNKLYSLACCKPQIRRMILKTSQSDNIENWVMAVRRDKKNGKHPFIVYLAKITEVLRLEEYYSEVNIAVNSIKYAERCDCKYRNVKTVNSLGVKITDRETVEKNYPNIYALDGNEHGTFGSIEELFNPDSDVDTEAVLKDLCGNAVLISDNFIHCSQMTEKEKERLNSCFENLLNEYDKKNMRCKHSFNNWSVFDETIKEINFKSEKLVNPLDGETKTKKCKHC